MLFLLIGFSYLLSAGLKSILNAFVTYCDCTISFYGESGLSSSSCLPTSPYDASLVCASSYDADAVIVEAISSGIFPESKDVAIISFYRWFNPTMQQRL